MHVPINVKSPNNTSKWQMGFNSAFKGLISPKFLSPLLKVTNIELRSRSKTCFLPPFQFAIEYSV